MQLAWPPSSVRIGVGARRLFTWDLALVALPAVALLLLPVVVWTRFDPTTMNLGGDDSHLIFVDPNAWMRHVASGALDLNMLGYNPRTFFLPLAAVLWVFHALGLNPEAVFLGAVLSAAYVGMWRLIVELLPRRGLTTSAAGVIGAAVATFAPVIAETQWNTLLMRIMWQALIPWLTLMVMWYQRTGRRRWLLAVPGLCAVTAAAINDAPTTISSLLLIAMLLAAAHFAGVTRLRVRRLAAVLSITIVANAFWLIPVLGNFPLHQAQFSSALSHDTRQDAVANVAALTPYIDWHDVAGLRLSHPLLTGFSSPATAIDSWSRNLAWLGLVPAVVAIVGALVTLRPGTDRRLRRVALAACAIAAVFLYFETVVIVPFGQDVMIFFMRHLPGWTAERNFYDKFAIPFAAAVGVATGVGAFALMVRLRARAGIATGAVAAAALALLCIYDLPFLRGDEFSQVLGPGSTYDRVMPGLPADYTVILGRLDHLPAGGILTMPLAQAAWSIVPGAGSHAYVGASPVFDLTGRSEYNGVDSFVNADGNAVGLIAAGDVARADMESLARLAGAVGVRYVLLDEGRLDVEPFTFNSAAAQRGLAALEVERMKRYAPTVVARSGSYELRELAPQWRWPTAYTVPAERCTASTIQANFGADAVSSDGACARTPLKVTSESASSLRVLVDHVSSGQSIVVSRVGSTLWSAVMRCQGHGAEAGVAVDARPIGEYANLFPVPSALSGCPLLVDVSYRGETVLVWGWAVTAFAAAGMLGVAVADRRRARRRLLIRGHACADEIEFTAAVAVGRSDVEENR